MKYLILLLLIFVLGCHDPNDLDDYSYVSGIKVGSVIFTKKLIDDETDNAHYDQGTVTSIEVGFSGKMIYCKMIDGSYRTFRASDITAKNPANKVELN